MSKIYLNDEAAIILDTLASFQLTRSSECTQTLHMMVCMDEYEMNGDEFLGFVGTMKAHISKETKIVNKNI